MKVGVVGTGYVGLVVGACLAETGNDVICADVDEDKIKALKNNEIPIYEPGLEPLVNRNQAKGRLQFTTDVGATVEASEVVFIAVGTPPGEDGSADLQHVLDVAKTVGEHLNSPKVVVTKSTVPVGTAEKVRRMVAEYTPEKFHVCSNPEFLKEGGAVEDFMKPDRVIIGVDSKEAERVIRELYAPFVRTGKPMIVMDVASAELTKYASNAMLATRISFMNQMAELCENVGADIGQVRQGMGSDSRIGTAFLFAGPGYGGSCFPKDVRALIHTSQEAGVALDLMESVEEVNRRQKQKLGRMLSDSFEGDLQGKRVAVWGLAFKARTDDVRESPSIELIRYLVNSGAEVRVHDPEALESAKAVLGNDVQYHEEMYGTLEAADALVVVTEWLEYRNPDFPRIMDLLRRPLIVDGRNLYDPERIGERGFEYLSIGRTAVK